MREKVQVNRVFTWLETTQRTVGLRGGGLERVAVAGPSSPPTQKVRFNLHWVTLTVAGTRDEEGREGKEEGGAGREFWS